MKLSFIAIFTILWLQAESSLPLFEILNIQSKAANLAKVLTDQNQTNGAALDSLLIAETPSDIKLLGSYITENVRSTGKLLSSALQNAIELGEVLENQESAYLESSLLAKAEPIKVLKNTENVTRKILTNLNEIALNFSVIISNIEITKKFIRSVGPNKTEYHIPASNKSAIGNNVVAIKNVLTKLVTHISQLNGDLTKIQKGVKPLGLSQFGVDPISQFTAAEQDLGKIKSGDAVAEKAMSVVADYYNNSTDGNSFATVLKNFVAPLCLAIIKFYQTGLNASSLSAHLSSIVADLTNA